MVFDNIPFNQIQSETSHGSMDPVAPKKLRGHISTAMLRFFASGLSWIKTLAHDGDNDDGEKWRTPMMEDNLLYHLIFD